MLTQDWLDWQDWGQSTETAKASHIQGERKESAIEFNLVHVQALCKTLGNAPKKTQLIVELASIKHLAIIVVYAHRKMIQTIHHITLRQMGNQPTGHMEGQLLTPEWR